MDKQARVGAWAWVGAGLVIASAACGVIGYRLLAVNVEVTDVRTPEAPHTNFRAEAANGQVEFHPAHDDAARRMSALTVLDEADSVPWQVGGQGRGRVPVVVYGRVPAEPDAE